MNSVLKATSLVALTCGLVACGGDIEDKTTTPQNYHDITVDLQGTVFNALTGATIDLPKDTVVLRQGTDYRNASTAKNWEGDFAFRNIPASAELGNVEYELRANVPGYQAFRAIMVFDINASDDANKLQDKKANWVSSIYLYPVGVAAADYQVAVTYNGQRVPNATVYLDQRGENNVAQATQNSNSNRIKPANGLIPSLTATTDADGIATFAGSNLVLGGVYNARVQRTSFNGIELAQPADVQFTVGTNSTLQSVDMFSLISNQGLFVVSASNEVTGSIQEDGKLIITFNQEVDLVNPKDIDASLAANPSPKAQLKATDAVTAALSTDGKTLTLTPAFEVNPVKINASFDNSGTADNGLIVEYSNVLVRIRGSNNKGVIDIGDIVTPIVTSSGVALSLEVQVTPEFEF